MKSYHSFGEMTMTPCAHGTVSVVLHRAHRPCPPATCLMGASPSLVAFVVGRFLSIRAGTGRSAWKTLMVVGWPVSLGYVCTYGQASRLFLPEKEACVSWCGGKADSFFHGRRFGDAYRCTRLVAAAAVLYLCMIRHDVFTAFFYFRHSVWFIQPRLCGVKSLTCWRGSRS